MPRPTKLTEPTATTTAAVSQSAEPRSTWKKGSAQAIIRLVRSSAVQDAES